MPDFPSLQSSFRGDLITSADPGYEAAIDRWAHNASKRAKTVAFVKDAQDVSLTIQYAKRNNVPIAIRCGGHSAAGSSSVENGLVIDLSRYLNTVIVDAGKRLVYVGGGALWSTVDHNCIQRGLAAVGGTVNHTGVGGLTLGGGYGWLSGQHGLAIDNLVQATVVVGDGSVLTTNASEQPDLFWGIRRGGCNFGVVTEFVFRLHPQRKTVFGGLISFIDDKLEQIAAALDVWWEDRQEKAACMCLMTLVEKKPYILLQLFYNGSEAEGKEHFKAFYDIGPFKADASEIPYEELNTLNNVLAPPNHNYYMKGTLLSDSPSKDLSRKIVDRLVEVSPEDMNVAILLEYLPYDKINSVHEDETPYRRNMPGNALFLMQWEEHTPEKQNLARSIAHDLANLMPEGEGYGNYGGIDDVSSTTDEKPLADKTQVLFGKHYPRLQELKKKYDPDMMFRRWYPITPAT